MICNKVVCITLIGCLMLSLFVVSVSTQKVDDNSKGDSNPTTPSTDTKEGGSGVEDSQKNNGGVEDNQKGGGSDDNQQDGSDKGGDVKGEDEKKYDKDLDGELDVIAADDLLYMVHHDVFYHLKYDGKYLNLNVSKLDSEALKDFSSADFVNIKGKSSKEELNDGDVVNVDDLKLTRKRSITDTEVTERKVVVLIVDINSYLRCPCNPASLSSSTYTSIQSVAGVYREVSGGRVTLNGDIDGIAGYDIFGPFNLGLATPTTCDYVTWANLADAKASAAGVPLSLYQHKVYMLPNQNTLPCNWAGMGNVGCGTQCRSWTTACASPSAIAHEIGHNLGLQHANKIDNGVETAYMDLSCLMGGSGFWREFNQPHKIQLGWTPSNLIVDLGTFVGTRTVTLAPSELQSPTNPQAIRSPTAIYGKNYIISYRAPSGTYDTSSNSYMGNYYYKLSIHTQAGAGTTALVQTVGVGQTFSDANAGLTVRLVSQTATSATVSITKSR